MPITKLTMWQTSDKKTFLDITEAEANEAELELHKMLVKLSFPGLEPKLGTKWLVSNAQELSTVLGYIAKWQEERGEDQDP